MKHYKYKPKRQCDVHKQREKNNRRQRLKRRERKDELVRMLGNKCARCGLEEDLVVYDFNHINPGNKLFNISQQLMRGGDSHYYNNVIPEAGKCILLCANCHRIVHFGMETENINYKGN